MELAECEAWGLLQPAFAATQRQHLHSTAAQELVHCKQLCVELAREHGVLEEFVREMKVRQLAGWGIGRRAGGRGPPPRLRRW